MTTTTKIEFGFKSDVGRRRDTNEDSCAVLNRDQLNGRLDALLIVADGLGGRRAGEVASSLLVDTVSLGVLEATEMRVRPLSASDVEQLLMDTIVRANGTIMTQGRFQKRADARGMATTCVSAIVHENSITIGNVGDSRLYLMRDGALQQVTQDHSEVYREFVKGNITESEARNHRFRNQITRAVGLEPNVEPDITTLALKDGDQILLCSDGLTTEVPDEVIGNVLAAATSAQNACDMLVSIALRHGGRDNVTVVTMRFGDTTPTGSFDINDFLLEEPDTDPNQEWRSEPRPDEQLSWADDAPAGGTEERSGGAAPPVRSTSAAGRASGVTQLALAVIALLVLGMLVEGAFIYKFSHEAHSGPVNPAPPPQQPAAHQESREYNAPTVLMDTKVLPDILQISPQGNPIIATLDGKLQTFLIKQHKLLPMRGVIPYIPHAAAEHAGKPKDHADIYSDPDGTLYFLNPETKCIETYTATGTRTNQDLGKGDLVAPTKIIVDVSGAVYIIDDNRLKVLTTKEVPKASAHPLNADF